MSTEDNALALSDEEFEKLPVPTETVVEVSEDPPTEEPIEALEEPVEASEEATDTEATPEEEESSQEAKTEVVEEQPTQAVDYENIYKEIFKPFKANGKDMTVDSVDDVRQLMQMGANYNKKMAGLKPTMKFVKMLENNGLLDEQKLAFLIDLDKKNPDAVKKLIKDSGLDPLEVDINQEISYKANTYNVSDKEIELDTVLSEIKETESFNTTIDIIGNKWDDNSKKVLLENPNLIKVINSHVSNGIYQNITSEVEKLRVLGKLDGMSDIDAYKAVGDVMYSPKVGTPTSLGNNQNTSTSKATNKEDPRLVEKRKAASTTKSVASNVKPDFNPLAMSDEEFEKIATSKFI